MSRLWEALFADDVEAFRGAVAAGTSSSHGRVIPSSSPGNTLLSTSASSPSMTMMAAKSPRPGREPRRSSGPGFTTITAVTRADINFKTLSGTTLMHTIASSTSPQASAFATSLLEHISFLDLYAQDDESGWTALHRALYNGNIMIARALMARDWEDAMKFGPSGVSGGLIKIKDREGYSPFDLYGASIANRIIRPSPSVAQIAGSTKDEDVSGDANDDLYYSSSLAPTPRTNIEGDEVFAFGSNKNFNLGLGDEDDRQFPEKVSLQRPDHLVYRFYKEYKEAQEERLRQQNYHHLAETAQPFGLFETPAAVRFRTLTIQNVELSKLHSAILTTDPEANLYVCGFGSGGRLGTGDEKTRFSYANICGGGLAGKRVIHVALGQNHSIAITGEGETFTWGSNLFGQLGYAPNSTSSGSKDEEPVQLLPRQVYGPLKREVVVGAAASRIHSAMITTSSLFTCGKNEGQMGLVDSDARSLISQNTPRKVGASLFTALLSSVSAIDRATICLLDNREVWVFANYGYTKVVFPTDSIADLLLEGHGSLQGSKSKASRTTIKGNEVCKVTSGGDTICAMTCQGDLFTMHVSQKAEPTSGSVGSASTTNPSKIRGALSQPQRIWSTKKAYMAVRDVDVGQDGSVIICTNSGSVWRRIKRAKIKDASSSALGSAGYKAKDYKFSRVPGLTKIAAVRSNAFGAYAAIRQDSDVLKTQIEVDSTTLWRDIFPLLPLQGYGAEDSDTEEPAPRFWVSQEPSSGDVSSIRHAVLVDPHLEQNLIEFLAERQSASEENGYDLQVGSTVSDVRIPINAFVLAARSPVALKGLRTFNQSYYFSIPDVFSLEYDNDGKALLMFQGIDILTLLNLVMYIYTDSVVDVWHFTRRAPALAYRYRQVRAELMKVAAHLEMRKLEHAVRLMTEPPRTLHEDMEAAIHATGFFDDAEIEIVLDVGNTKQKVHSALVCRRCPFFEGLFQGRAAGRWISHRRAGNEEEDFEPISVDFSHVSTRTFAFVLQHLYGDVGEQMFDDVVVADLDAYLDLVVEVLSVANELMLDRLAEACQKVLGRFVTTRNVCQLLNAVAPCSVPLFKNAALEYICLNLEGILENNLLGELDDDLMLELDEVVRENQLDCLPHAKSENALSLLVEQHPQLPERLDRAKEIKIDQVYLQSRLREREGKLFGGPKATDDLLEDFEPTQTAMARKSPKIAPRDLDHSSRRSPLLRAKDSMNDLMFDMDISDDEWKTVDRSRRKSSHSSAMRAPLSAIKEGGNHALKMEPLPSAMLPEAAVPPLTDVDPADAIAGQHMSHAWATPKTPTSKLDMRDIMAQAGGENTAAASPQGLRASASARVKMSQKDRKKMRHAQQQSSAQEMSPRPLSESTPSKPASPWQKTSPQPPTSLKDIINAKDGESDRGKKSQSTSMTLRQTVAGKPSPAKRTMSSEAAASSQESRNRPVVSTTGLRSVSSPGHVSASGLASPPPPGSPSSGHPLSPPRSLSTTAYTPPIQSIRHITPTPGEDGNIPPSSIKDILSQQQTEKDIIRDAVAKRSLVEIQAEQEFQQWWEQESAKVQGLHSRPQGAMPQQQDGEKKRARARVRPRRGDKTGQSGTAAAGGAGRAGRAPGSSGRKGEAHA